MTGRNSPSTKGEGMWSASRTRLSPARGTQPTSLIRSFIRDRALYPSRAAHPASQTAPATALQLGAAASFRAGEAEPGPASWRRASSLRS